MKKFITTGIVMCLVLISCDASIMSSESSDKYQGSTEGEGSTGITGIYRNGKYIAELAKDKDEEYLLKFCDDGIEDNLYQPECSPIISGDEISFKFLKSDSRRTYTVSFNKEDSDKATLKKNEEDPVIILIKYRV